MHDKTTLGWREWVALPELGIAVLKAKVDTGARTSTLHAFRMETFERNGQTRVRFAIHPFQKRTDVVVECEADVVDQREVTDSGGHKELRYVIRTPVHLAGRDIPVEITLTDRDTMKFRMLLGRTSLREGFVVDPAGSYMTGKPQRKKST
ncbi:MAG: ATP-dependent zinc protease [Gammaproteobacteria bacterium]|nr:ATP-dependent zinc protease [Gammaproteobacteria bacterium]MBU2478212.1 ATP-dependent zinc protease [Gammaproteobacteria bacterium]